MLFFNNTFSSESVSNHQKLFILCVQCVHKWLCICMWHMSARVGLCGYQVCVYKCVHTPMDLYKETWTQPPVHASNYVASLDTFMSAENDLSLDNRTLERGWNVTKEPPKVRGKMEASDQFMLVQTNVFWSPCGIFPSHTFVRPFLCLDFKNHVAPEQT